MKHLLQNPFFNLSQPLLVENQWQDKFGVRSIREDHGELTAAVYLQVSIVSQALIFVTRSRSWSYVERPGLLLVFAFLSAQLVSIKCMCSYG